MSDIENIRVKLVRFRRNQTIFVILVMLMNVVITTGIISYYRFKEQALCGAMYLADQETAKSFIRNLFNISVSADNVNAGKMAMKQIGYGSNGFLYAERINGEFYLFIIIGIVMMLLLLIGLTNCYKIGNNYFFNAINTVIEENKKISLH